MSYPFLSEVRKHFIEIMIVVLEFMERDNGGGGGGGAGVRNIQCRGPAPCCVALAGKNSDVESPAISGHLPYARCTLADPTPQLASNIVVGKSGQIHAMHFRRHVGSPFTWLPNGRGCNQMRHSSMAMILVSYNPLQ